MHLKHRGPNLERAEVRFNRYYDDMEIPDLNTALELYKLADKYLLDALKKEWVEHIVAQINADNNNAIITFADQLNLND